MPSHSFRSALAALSFAALLLGASSAHASSAVTVKNQQPGTIRVYWTALGCAGVTDGRTFVCHHADIAPGATTSYSYKLGTSSKELTFFSFSCPDVGPKKTWKVVGTKTQLAYSDCTMHHDE